MRKVIGSLALVLFMSVFGIKIPDLWATSITSVSGGDGVDVVATNNSDGTSAVLYDLAIEGSFDTDQLIEVYISGDSGVGLSFRSTGTSVEVGSGMTNDSLVEAADKISVKVSGSGTVALNNIGVYISGTTEAAGNDRLRVQINGVDYYGGYFSATTIEETVTLTGAGGTNGAFVKGNYLSFSIDSPVSGATYTLDLSGIGETASLAEGESVMLSAGTIDGSYSFPVTIDYGGGNTQTIQSDTVTVDTESSSFGGTGSFSGASGSGGTIFMEGDTLTYTAPTTVDGDTFVIDLSEIGLSDTATDGVGYVVGTVSEDISSITFPVVATDNAGNKTSFTSDAIALGDALPSFDTTCGGTFSVTDVGDSNGIADATNNGSDSVVFTPPDGSLVGCTYAAESSTWASYSVDLSGISGNTSDNIVNGTIGGADITLNVGVGSLDSLTQTFTITITDTDGDENKFSSGELKIDNDIFVAEETEFIIGGSPHPDGEFRAGDQVRVDLNSQESDLASIQVEISQVIETTTLANHQGNVWMGNLQILDGDVVDTAQELSITLWDDAGNTVYYTPSQTIRVSNETTVHHMGSGGTGSLHTPNRQKVRRDTLHTILEDSVQTELEKQREESLHKAAEEKVVEQAPDRPMINRATYYDDFRAQLVRERQRMKRGTVEPHKLKNKMRKLFFPSANDRDWYRGADVQGGFRFQATQSNLKKIKRRREKVLSPYAKTMRKTDIFNRGKYGRVVKPGGRMGTVR